MRYRYAATLRKQPTAIGIVSVMAPPFVLLSACVAGAKLAAALLAFPACHVAVVSFGMTALLYLVVVELLREAHAGMGEEATAIIEVRCRAPPHPPFLIRPSSCNTPSCAPPRCLLTPSPPL